MNFYQNLLDMGNCMLLQEFCIYMLIQNTRKLGEYAAEKLIDLIEKPRTTLIEQIVVQGSVYEGNSVLDLNNP
jgi:DNA-binding LacI/PurR family transcriptional regulator